MVTAREDVVIDASALVTLLMNGEATGDAIAARLATTRIHVPQHLFVEVTNVLRRQRNAGRLTEPQASAALRDLLEIPMQTWPFEVTAARTWELGPHLSSYDAAYVALAEHLRSPLVTLDKRIARAPGVRCAVEVIGEE